MQDNAGSQRFVLVATTNYLLLVNIDGKTTIPIENGRPEYYGITWDPRGDGIILSHSGLNNSDLIDISSYATSEVGYLSAGIVTTEPFLSAPHQILFGSDRRIIATNTGRNSITVYDPEMPGHFQEKRVSASRWDRLNLENTLGDHLNSVFQKDDMLFVVAHGHKHGSSIVTLSYPQLEIQNISPVAGRTGLHNIWISDDGQQLCCHSNIGGLIEVNANKVIWESGSRIYTRGLAVARDFIVVGESQMTNRDQRRSSMSGLWVLDRQSFATLDHICLGPYGAVNEVRLLNVADLAHHGQPFTDVKSLLPNSMFEKISYERLEAAQNVLSSKQLYAEFELVYGVPVYGQNTRQAAIDLCLIRKKSVGGSKHEISFFIPLTIQV